VNTAALRTLLIYAIILPLAIFVGLKLSGDMTRNSFAMLTAIAFVLLLPLLLKWRYEAMLLSWNTSITIFFLPGKPGLWMLMAGLNFGIALLHRIIQKQRAFLPAPSVTIPLLVLLAIIIGTAKMRGGIGIQALGGSTFGGKGYIYLIAGVLAYFAFVSQPIPPQRARLFIAMFLLPGLIHIGSTLTYYAGPAFYFLYVFFPAGVAGVQAASEYAGGVVRFAGFSTAAVWASLYLMARHGIRGLFKKWWRPLLLLVAFAVTTFGGYRSSLLIIGFVLLLLFVMEGLVRTAALPAFLLVGVLAFAALVPLANKLPRSVQRTLSVVPGLRIDSRVRHEAQGSTEWRLHIWRSLLPDLPKYIWMGKGYAINPTDLYLTDQAMRRGRARDYEGALLAGDYHSGPLSVYVPFGSFGLAAFVAFLITSMRAIYFNYRYGSEELRTINRFLVAWYGVKIFSFIFIFGAFSNDLAQFAATVGLSIALNHGIARKPVTVARPVVFRGALGGGNVQPGTA
jgi:hypothetical protein